MDYIIKRASSLTAEEKTVLGITGIPADWPVESYPYTGNVPSLFEQISDTDLDILKNNNRAAYDAWLQAMRPIIVPTPAAPVDADNAPLSRIKTASLGMTFQYNCIHYHTSVKDSLVHNDILNNPLNQCSSKYYKLVNGTETEITGDDLNQIFLDANCMRTDLFWELPQDEELIGAKVRACDSIDGNDYLYLWVRGVPDVTYQYGGCKDLIINLNFRCVPARNPVVLDGRTVKRLNYNATYHTNKFWIVLRHNVGFKVGIQLEVEYYKL